jgi:hypothetical protein
MQMNPGAIVAGLLFIGLAVAFGLDSVDAWEVRGGLALSVMVIGVGVALLASALWHADRAHIGGNDAPGP